jgi:hypothetical protein
MEPILEYVCPVLLHIETKEYILLRCLSEQPLWLHRIDFDGYLKFFLTIEKSFFCFMGTIAACLVHSSIELTMYLCTSKDWNNGPITSKWITTPVL